MLPMGDGDKDDAVVEGAYRGQEEWQVDRLGVGRGCGV